MLPPRLIIISVQVLPVSRVFYVRIKRETVALLFFLFISFFFHWTSVYRKAGVSTPFGMGRRFFV
jgi:hypothetical protein